MSADGPKPRRRRFLWIAVSALLIYTVGGFFIAPPIIKSQLEKRASEALGRTVTVGKVRVNPYTASLTLEQFDIRLRHGDGSFVRWDRLYVNADPLASVFGTLTAKTIELDGFRVTALLLPGGKFAFDDILQRLANTEAKPAGGPPSAPPKVPSIRIGRLQVRGARADFTDESRRRPFTTTFGPTSFTLTGFRTVASGSGAPYQFQAVTEAGERFDWSGTLGIEPFRSAGEVLVENIDVPKYVAYHGDFVKGEIQSGKVTFRGRYELNLATNARVMKVSGGAVQLRNLKLADGPGGETAVELPAIDVSGIDADAVALKATIASVDVAGGHVRVQREADGKLNLLTMIEPWEEPAAPEVAPLPPPAPTPPAEAAAAPAAAAPPSAFPLPEVLIRSVKVSNFSVAATDLAAPRPVQLGLSGMEAAVENITLADNAVAKLQAGFTWAPQGTVKVEGTATLRPELRADLKVDVAALEFLPLSPYLEQFVNARIAQGAISTAGTARAVLGKGPPDIQFEGAVTVDKLGLVDGAASEELIGFARLELKEIKAATAPELSVALAEINLTGPYARVIVTEDRTLNLLTVARIPQGEEGEAEGKEGGKDGGNVAGNVGGASRPDSAVSTEPSGPKAPPTSDPAAAAPAPALPKIEVGRVIIADGEFSLLDRSLRPHVRVAATKAGGTIGAMSSANLARGDVNLFAVVDGIAPVSVRGMLDPFGEKRFIDLEVDLKNMELVPFSPYSGRYAGYEIQRGKLHTNLKVKLDGKQLDATDNIVLDQFTFGGPVASPEATSLPVRLGVALLKDTNGQIVIDVPVSGSIDDPEVRLRKAIMRVVVNILTKAATSPFSLLGAILGGDTEGLAYQEFDPGSIAVRDSEKGKLETVLKMLNARPELGVGIEGSYDVEADTRALQRLKLARLVRGRTWEERRAVDPNIPPPGEYRGTPEENLAAVRKLYDEKFPPGTEFGAALPPEPEAPATAEPAAPPPKPGFFRRVIDAITGTEAQPNEPSATEMKERYSEVKELAAEEGIPVEQMVDRLAGTMEVSDDDLRALAAGRTATIRDYFLNEGKIAPERIFLTQTLAADQAGKGPRVFLSPQ